MNRTRDAGMNVGNKTATPSDGLSTIRCSQSRSPAEGIVDVGELMFHYSIWHIPDSRMR